MIKLGCYYFSAGLCILCISATAHAEGFIKTEVYSYKDKNGNLIFTDKKPSEEKTFKTDIIEAANSSANSQDNALTHPDNKLKIYLNNTQQTIKIIRQDRQLSNKKLSKKETSTKRCKTYKKKFTYYSNKMKAGYKNSEYAKLESNRDKYKNLLFNNCATKTFND